MPENPYTVLQLSIHLPGREPFCTDCTIMSNQRRLPGSLVLDNTTDNYNQLVAELGEMLWNLRQSLRTTR